MTVINSYKNCYAKALNNELTYTVEEHCILVSLIGKQILNFLNFEFCNETLLIFALHDIGKIYPTFQQKIYNYSNIQLNYFSSNDILKIIDKETGYHSTISSKFINNVNFKNIVDRHHGYSSNQIRSKIINDNDFGFINFRNSFYNYLLKYFNITDENFKIYLSNLTSINVDFLSGILVLSDWIASGILSNYSKNIYDNNINDILKNELLSLGFFEKINLKKNLKFEDIFGFIPYESQEKIISNINDYGIYFIEEEMGKGKTETAFYAAYKNIIKYNMRGISFLLPTKLTSNKIYDRFNLFLKKILINPIKSNLLYGDSNVYLKATEKICKNIENESKYDSLISESELFKNKYLIFQYPYNTGTIDQALFSILNTKFNFVKLSSFYNKIIIIDEIHSYDKYTITLINYLIKYAKELKCIIIALSATIPNTIKNIFFNNSNSFSDKYPLLTYSNNNEKFKEIPIDINRQSKKIKISISDNDEKIIQNIINLAEKGAQIGWIESSRKKAQKIYLKIKQKINNSNIEIGLIHSKFIQSDRTKNEEYWTNILGKNGKNRYEKGRILIGTQILEQSIDIDFDKLITRISTIDMIFQRCGRLHRHNNKRIKECEIPECIILSETFEKINSYTNEKDLFLNLKDDEYSGLIYPKHLLYSTLKYFSNKTEILLPLDIRNAMNYVFSFEDKNNDIFKKIKFMFEQECKNKFDYAENNVYKNNITCIKGKSCETRLIEEKTLNLILVKDIIGENTIIFLNGDKIILNNNEYSNEYIKYISKLSSINEDENKFKKYLDNSIYSYYLNLFFKDSLILKLKNNELYTIDNKLIEDYIYDSKVGLLYLK